MKRMNIVRIFVFFVAFNMLASLINTVTAYETRIEVDVEGLKAPEGKEIILKVYEVQRTDSLANIAQRKLGDWKKWKVIYEYNSYIRDSHWIFPGDKLIVPVLVEKLPEVPDIDIEEAEVEIVAEPRGYKDFIATEDFSFDGSIIDFRDEKAMYAQTDYCFIDVGKYDGVMENYKFNIYRPVRQVTHPSTGRLMGTLMKKKGSLRVTGDIEQNSATAVITMSHSRIEKGDLLLLSE